MWRSKKFIVIAALIAVVVIGSAAGVVYAQTPTTSETPAKTLFARVSEKLGIDQQELENTFAEAQKEIRDEALDSYLKKLVEEDKITQEQADNYKEWWQARPDTPIPGPFGFGGHRLPGGMWGRGLR